MDRLLHVTSSLSTYGRAPIETDLLAKSPCAEPLAQVTEHGGGFEPNHAVAVVGQALAREPSRRPAASVVSRALT